MLTTITKIIFILVTVSAEPLYNDFLAEENYYKTLVECFKIHGETLVENINENEIDE